MCENNNDFMIKDGVLCSYEGPGGDVTVPEGVTKIGEHAFDVYSKLLIAFFTPGASVDIRRFEESENLKRVILPEGLKSIGCSAFFHCDGLRSVELPESLERIGDKAFGMCNSLTSIDVPESVTDIGANAFKMCTALKRVTLPKARTSFGKGVFMRCTGLKRVVLPDRTTSIPEEMFAEDECLMSVTIPESVKRIGASAFSGCSALKSIALPDGLLSIGMQAFKDCWSLESVILTKGLREIENGTFYNCVMLTSIDVPEGVTSIGDRAFKKCRKLASVTLPESLRQIGTGAFRGCINLRSVVLPKHVKTIGEDAFPSEHMVRIVIPDEAANSPEAFEIRSGVLERYCGPGGDVVVPQGVTKIGNQAFRGCNYLKSIALPDGVKQIGDRAFFECRRLVSAVLPEGLTVIGSEAFKGCGKLTYLTLPQSLERVAYSQFKDCKLAIRAKRWTPILTDVVESAQVITVVTEDIRLVPPKHRLAAALGFALAPDSDVSTEHARICLFVLSTHAHRLMNDAFHKPELLLFLCRNKLIKARDLDLWLKEAEKRNDTPLKAILLNYSNAIILETPPEQMEKHWSLSLTEDSPRRKASARRSASKTEEPGEEIIRCGVTGLTFVRSGAMRYFGYVHPYSQKRDYSDLKEYLQERGGFLRRWVSSETDFLICSDPDSESKKSKKAKELGVPVVTEEEFLKMAGEAE